MKAKLMERKKKNRVFKIGELDGFYIDRELDRTVHITFEERDIVVIDIYDTARAAYSAIGNALGIVELNLKNGEAKCFKEGR